MRRFRLFSLTPETIPTYLPFRASYCLVTDIETSRKQFVIWLLGEENRSVIRTPDWPLGVQVMFAL